MALARLHTRAQNGLDADEVVVEVHLSGGLPGLSIVGLPEAAVREAKDRVRAAILSCGYPYPARRITVNLAPADLPKHGGRFDLAIALGILAASGEIDGARLEGVEILGELSLSGALRPVTGVLPAALQCRRAGRRLLLPRDNAAEAALARDLPLIPAHHLGALCAQLRAGELQSVTVVPAAPARSAAPDLAEVRGQHAARRALEIAAAGGHSLLMVGPPGTGKTMLAQRLPGILPPLSEDEALEVASVASIRGSFRLEDWGRRPFRAPHHTASGIALVGGGSHPRPGEITLAHRGVLFLDELPEFDRRVLEVLREPLESGRITISRAARQVEFPARFQLVAAMNPCPCGHLGDPARACRCTPDQIARYRGRLSGPLLDRIDMQITVPREPAALSLRDDGPAPEPSAAVRERVIAARARQFGRSGCCNAELGVAGVQRHCIPDEAGRALLERAARQLGLSARAHHRVLKLARTIADLAGEERIGAAHVAEAIGYRDMDRAAGA